MFGYFLPLSYLLISLDLILQFGLVLLRCFDDSFRLTFLHIPSKLKYDGLRRILHGLSGFDNVFELTSCCGLLFCALDLHFGGLIVYL